jgi:parallel beta-helix repeat protein
MGGTLSWMWRAFGLLLVLMAAACASNGGGEPLPPSSSIEPEWHPPTEAISPDETTNASAVEPGEDLQAALDAAGPEATVVVGTGTHRVGSLQPRSGQTIVGQPGASLSGADVIQGFRPQDGAWTATAPVVINEERGTCLDDRPACVWPQELFVDGEIVPRVSEPSELTEDNWFLDFETRQILLGFDPGERIVELSVRQEALGGEAEGVTVKGLVIEKYASLAQFGTVNPRSGWTIENNEIRLNHGIGIKSAGGVTIKGNYLHHNGQFGIAGGGVGITIVNNEIARNGIGGFSALWAAGGTKFIHTSDLEIADNFVYENLGPGLWADAAGDQTVYEGNRVFNNEHAGIKHEISGSAVIRDNEVRGNGFGHSVRFRGAGVLVRESGPTEILSNVIAGNRDQLVLLQQDERDNDTGNRLDEASIVGNEITLGGGMVGFTGDIPDVSAITFADNQYFGDPMARSFLALGDELTYADWTNEGRDTDSSFVEKTDG